MRREETSNNRIRSGPHRRRGARPIDLVPAAGARQGTANGIETTEAGLAIPDPEDIERSPGVRPLSLQVSPAATRPALPTRSSTVEYTETGGALLMSPDGRRTPVNGPSASVELLSPIHLSSRT